MSIFLIFIFLTIKTSHCLTLKKIRAFHRISDPDWDQFASSVIITRNLIFVSGQRGLKSINPDKCNKDNDETLTALENVIDLIYKTGGSRDIIVHMKNYLTDLGDLPKLDEAYKKVFANSKYPTRTVIQVAALRENAKIEIDAIAVFK